MSHERGVCKFIATAVINALFESLSYVVSGKRDFSKKKIPHHSQQCTVDGAETIFAPFVFHVLEMFVRFLESFANKLKNFLEYKTEEMC